MPGQKRDENHARRLGRILGGVILIALVIVGLVLAPIPTLIAIGAVVALNVAAVAAVFIAKAWMKSAPKIKHFFNQLFPKKSKKSPEKSEAPSIKRDRKPARKWTKEELEAVSQQITVDEQADPARRETLLAALARENASLDAAKAEPSLTASFEALKQILQNHVHPLNQNIRLEKAIALLGKDVTSPAEWAAAFQQAGFGLQAELESAITFQTQKKTVFAEQLTKQPIQPLGGMTRNEVYILDQQLVVKPIANKQALRHELAAREMSELLGLPTLKTTVGHLVTVQEPEAPVFEALTEADPDSPERRAVFQKTQQYTQRKIARQIKPDGHASDVVLVQEFAQRSTSSTDYIATISKKPQQDYQTALVAEIQRMGSGTFFEKIKLVKAAKSDLPALQELPIRVESTLDESGKAALTVLQNIDLGSYQLAVVKSFTLGDLDNNFGNILLIEKQNSDAYDVCLIDFEEIMPENNIATDRPTPIAVDGKQNLQTGEIRDLKYEYKTSKGTVSFFSALLALPQAKQAFQPQVVGHLLERLDLELLARYHRATSEKNGFNAKQIAAQRERIEYFRAQCQAQWDQERITLTPRDIYNHFYEQNPAYQKAQEEFKTDFVTYQMVGRISETFAREEKKTKKKSRKLLHTTMKKTVEAQQRAQFNLFGPGVELDLSIPASVINDERADQIVTGFEVFQQQSTERIFSCCTELHGFLGVKPTVR